MKQHDLSAGMARKRTTPPEEALDHADTRRLSALEGGCTAAAAILTGLATGDLDKALPLICMDAWAQHLDADGDALAEALAEGTSTGGEWDKRISARLDTSEKRDRVLRALERLRLRAALELFLRQRETRRHGAEQVNADKRREATKLAASVIAEDRSLLAKGYAKKAARIEALKAKFKRGETFIKKCLKSGSRRSA